jgi:selenide,water dikinase
MSESIPEAVADLMYDPQTSGGLILGVPAKRAAEVLDVLSKEGVKPIAEIGEVLAPHEEGRLEIE